MTLERSVGIDIALRRTGIVGLVRENGGPWALENCAVVEVKPKEKLDILSFTGFTRYRAKVMLALHDWAMPTHLTIEHITQYGTYMTAIKIQTARAALYQSLDFHWEPGLTLPGENAMVLSEISPQVWKRALLGKPNADKEFTLAQAKLDPIWSALFAPILKDNDLLDAGLLALYPFSAAARFGI